MYIVVSNNKNTPTDLIGKQVEHWTMDEFIDKADSEDENDGLQIDEGLYIDVSCLEENIYQAIIPWMMDPEIDIKLYKFDIDPDPGYNIDMQVLEYSYDIDEPEPEPEPEIPSIPAAPVVNTIPEQPVINNPIPEPHTQPETNQYNYQDNEPAQLVEKEQPKEESHTDLKINDIKVTGATDYLTRPAEQAMKEEWDNLLDAKITNMEPPKKDTPAKVILFGSSKGGTGKTFTCLISAYWYAKTHPDKRVALADFDIIDGQIGITISKNDITVLDYYGHYINNNREMKYLYNSSTHAQNFPSNIDFYLAPPQEIPEITNNDGFWDTVFRELITHYDVVFFDSGIDYLGKPPISKLYKIADKIIITCNPSINSVRSVIKQIGNLTCVTPNNVFYPEDKIGERIRLVLTRVYDNEQINETVFKNLSKYARIIAAFGNIDNIVSRIQWYKEWGLIDTNQDIIDALELFIDLSDITD